MTVHVLVPWHDHGDDQRRQILDHIIGRWGTTFAHWPLRLGALTADSDWCKADAVEIALRAACPADDDALVIADADVWADPDAIIAAVHAVESGSVAWAMPHRLVHRLNADATAAALVGLDYPTAAATFGYDRQPYVGTVGGGITVLVAAAYRTCPLDPRFVGWGQEDESWGEALRTIHGHRHRGMADLWHLWHEPMPRMTTGIGNQHGMYVRDQYRRCNGDPARMRRLIDSGREHLIRL
jgi:hypothetical protein